MLSVPEAIEETYISCLELAQRGFYQCEFSTAIMALASGRRLLPQCFWF